MKDAAKPLVYIFLVFFMIPAYLFSGFLMSTLISMQASNQFSALAEAFSDQEAIANTFSLLFILISAYMLFVEEKKNVIFKYIILIGLILMLCITLTSYLLPAQYFGVESTDTNTTHSITDIRKTFIDYTSNIVILWFLSHGIDITDKLSGKSGAEKV